ncbi:MAG: helix-turn-helix domain-containing protein [Alkalibacterium sp.]|nr:helix-turn-helix domain-containing protein [Alkalibacterium sp.]
MQNIGNARFVWNQFLNMWNERYAKQSYLASIERV